MTGGTPEVRSDNASKNIWSMNCFVISYFAINWNDESSDESSNTKVWSHAELVWCQCDQKMSTMSTWFWFYNCTKIDFPKRLCSVQILGYIYGNQLGYNQRRPRPKVNSLASSLMKPDGWLFISHEKLMIQKLLMADDGCLKFMI